MSVSLFLPPHLEALDLGPSLDLPAERLRAAAPEWLNARHPAADRALRYARGSGLSYEQISLWALLEGLRENRLTILAAREPRPADGEKMDLLSHRALRRRILRAQSLTDRHRFAQSIELLEPLLRGLQTLAGVSTTTRCGRFILLPGRGKCPPGGRRSRPA